MIGAACVFAMTVSCGEGKLDLKWDAFSIAPTLCDGCFIDGLVGQGDDRADASLDHAQSLTENVRSTIRELRDPSVARQATDVLTRLQGAIGSFDLTGLPSLRSFVHSDGSFTIEWRFHDRRLAFTVEHDPKETGWHFVSSRSSDDVQACGGLPDDLRPLLSLALRRMPIS
jgi:hypothetical protein